MRIFVRLIRRSLIALAIVAGLGLFASPPVFAALPAPAAKSGSVGLEGTISSDPPRQGATITTPVNGASFSEVPITINGLCPKGLLVKVFSNNVFIGSVQCETGSYSLQADLFSGQNELVARVYDALDQAGPDSNTVIVTFKDAQFALFGTHVSLSSIFAKKGANPGEVLDWPVLLSGGIGPYAISIDWGDGTPVDLQSHPFPGTLNFKHIYKSAGVYKIIIKATDSKGTKAFLQLVGVANGKVGQSTAAASVSGSSGRLSQVIWWPALAMLPLIFSAFWVGRRHELYTLRKHLEKSRG